MPLGLIICDCSTGLYEACCLLQAPMQTSAPAVAGLSPPPPEAKNPHCHSPPPRTPSLSPRHRLLPPHSPSGPEKPLGSAPVAGDLYKIAVVTSDKFAAATDATVCVCVRLSSLGRLGGGRG